MSQKAFQYIKDRRKFLNISAIEKHCGIIRTSLTNAISRNQKCFRQSGKLIDFLEENFGFSSPTGGNDL